MKKTVLIFILAGVMLSCGTTKMARQAQKTFKGDWTLTEITYPGSSGFVDVHLFEDASTNCFVNSDWHFVPNNNKGYYQLYKNDCSPGKRNFRWNVQQEDSDNGMFSFTLKPVDKEQNARKTKRGYRMNLVSLDNTQMVWEEQVSYEGKPFTIRMTFSKN